MLLTNFMKLYIVVVWKFNKLEMDGTGDHYPKSAKNIVVATTFHQDGVK